MMLNTSLINWQKVDGLLPVIVQHAQTSQVLMLGYMNNEALAKTINEGKIPSIPVPSNASGQRGKPRDIF